MRPVSGCMSSGLNSYQRANRFWLSIEAMKGCDGALIVPRLIRWSLLKFGTDRISVPSGAIPRPSGVLALVGSCRNGRGADGPFGTSLANTVDDATTLANAQTKARLLVFM